jgi:hypothetical protein
VSVIANVREETAIENQFFGGETTCGRHAFY